MIIPWRLSLWLQQHLPDFLLKPLRAVYTVYFVWAIGRVIQRQKEILPVLFPEQPARVFTGPFKGMKYIDTSICSLLLPKLIGCYEAEISEAIEKIVQNNYDRILNVGCAEGYYAVGLAMRSPKAMVFAFDIDPKAERLCKELAQLNGVADRVIFSGGCDAAKLNNTIQGKTVIISDCEGYEIELFDPAKAPKLAEADMLVELHGATDPKVSIRDTLIKRFENTHRGHLIFVARRNPSQYSILDKLSPKDRNFAVDECRSGTMEWGWWERKRQVGSPKVR